ncbi:MAG: family 43 glycosylhydrolase [Jatrophihabitantaceae bacterium]
MRIRSATSALLMITGLVAVPAAAQATAQPQHSSPASRHTRVAPAYHNPLTLRLPDGQQAASCADPFVLHGQTAGDRKWYLYCTSDALTATELGPDGKPLIHNLPMFSSTDLVHWRYAGDAFAAKPSWITGFMWAPDVVYRNGQYLLYFTASDTNLPGGGSAIGVATSSSPTGPWQAADTPVVPPTDAANGGGRRWEFDPEVIYDGSTGYLYFGSYFGGIYARQLSADGMTSIASTEKQIAIDNRYEGTFIVKHNGWYYFMGSATNCCNGPLTGYAVFSARSRSPLGPFVDAHGVSILNPRVGGTPLLTQNGNRWVGPGHNAVITDYSGQQWIVYHAVDRNDPYYAGDVGYTKRPALIDPLDWKGDWPVVRGGYGPSDSWRAGPAAQPGQRTAYNPQFVPQDRPGRPYRTLSDNFTGDSLSARWSWIRQPDPASYSVSGGNLSWQTQNADLHPPATPLASVLSEPAPRGDYVVETKVSVDVPTSGCCWNYVQGGLLVYGDDGNYVKLASVSIWNTRQTEFGKQQSPQPAGYPTYGNTVVGPVGDWTYLRIVHRARGGVDYYTAYTSLDGRHWDKGGTWTHQLGSAQRIGLISMGGSGFTSTFAYVHVSALAH